VWGLGQIGPKLSNHSLIILLLGIIGAAFIAPLMHLAVSRNEIRPILLGMLLYIAGQIFMPLAYQRYIEPVVLISLALIAAPSVAVSTWRISLFALMFAVYSLVGLLRIYNILPDIWLIASFKSTCYLILADAPMPARAWNKGLLPELSVHVDIECSSGEEHERDD